MKKTLVALAAIAATSAFADVSIVGTFDPTVIHATTTYADKTTASQTNMTYNGRATSAVIFKVTEDLGGGLTAIALMENDFQPQNTEDYYGKGADLGQPAKGTNFGSGGGEIYTGVTGGFGTVKLGSPNTPTLSIQAAGVFGTKLGSGFGEGIGGTGHVRQSQTVNYTTPSFGGLTVSWGHTFGQNADANALGSASSASAAVAGLKNAGSIDDIGVSYANGPVSAGVSYYKMSGVNGATYSGASALDNTLLSYQASYTFGAAMLQVGGHTETNAAVANSTTTTYSVVQANNNGTFIAGKYTMGATTLLAQISNLSDQSTLANNKHMTAVGFDYALSKNTTVYGRYSNLTVDNATGINLIAAGTTVNQQVAKQVKTAAGLQINF